VTPPPLTYSNAHLRRQRDAHARADGYGRHRHLYLHDTIRQLAEALASPNGRTWLDYGCGKGGFIEEIRPLGLFSTIAGHDPAVAAFSARPIGRFGLVTCLDVLDTVEANYRDAVVQDVAQLTASYAVFDCLTQPKPGGRLRPHPPFYWSALIRRQMTVVETRVEFPGMPGFERAVIIAVSSIAAPTNRSSS
jgi:hypothetical protein